VSLCSKEIISVYDSSMFDRFIKKENITSPSRHNILLANILKSKVDLIQILVLSIPQIYYELCVFPYSLQNICRTFCNLINEKRNDKWVLIDVNPWIHLVSKCGRYQY